MCLCQWIVQFFGASFYSFAVWWLLGGNRMPHYRGSLFSNICPAWPWGVVVWTPDPFLGPEGSGVQTRGVVGHINVDR